MGDPKVTACFVMSHQHCALRVVQEQKVGLIKFGDKYEDWRSAEVDYDIRDSSPSPEHQNLTYLETVKRLLPRVDLAIKDAQGSLDELGGDTWEPREIVDLATGKLSEARGILSTLLTRLKR